MEPATKNGTAVSPVEKKNPALGELLKRSANEIISSKIVEEKFSKLYELIHGRKNGATIYEREKFHFLKQLSEKPEVAKCTGISLYGSFLDAAVNGLSFDPSMKHCYLVPFGNKCTLMVSGYGELYQRQSTGQIKYADNPVLVYQGDKFTHGNKNGSVFIEHEAVFPRQSEKILACYLRIVRNDGSVDFKVLSMEEVEKLRAFSAQPNSLAWTKGLPGMVQSKTIKHAFKSYPKIRKGQFTQLESEVIDADVPIDYGTDVSGETVETSFSPAEDVTSQPASITHDDNMEEAY